jgi:hypothetical protein
MLRLKVQIRLTCIYSNYIPNYVQAESALQYERKKITTNK